MFDDDLYTEHIRADADEAFDFDNQIGSDQILCDGPCGDIIHIEDSIAVHMPDSIEQWCGQCALDHVNDIQQCIYCEEYFHIDLMATNDKCQRCDKNISDDEEDGDI